MMQIRNNKGYMLVEIILAFSITFVIMYFMMNLVVELKDKNDDLLVKTLVSTEHAIITNELMDFIILEKEKFTCDIKINNQKVIYTDSNGENNVIEIVDDYATLGNVDCKNNLNTNMVSIKIPIEVKQILDDNYEVNINYRYDDSNIIQSLGEESGITFRLFNYDNQINSNGINNYFSFTGSYGMGYYNNTYDCPYFNDWCRAKVLPNLLDGFPVYNCRNAYGCNNFSLGYLFGSNINPLGNTPVGVTSYNPINTLLQKDYATGYYYYDSDINAVDYDIENQQFLVRNYAEKTWNSTNYDYESDRSDFLPFNYWDETKSEQINRGRKYNYSKIETDYWFGMTMEFDFYMPENGKINGENMIFSFMGDDDVLVFIDDVLVLDLGGNHYPVEGEIDFATGDVFSRYKFNNVVGIPSNGNAHETNIYKMFENAEAIDKVDWIEVNWTKNKIFEDGSKHTLKFFYLERGSVVSTCKIKFNIQALRKNER